MHQHRTDPLQVQLNLDSQPTIGALRAFLDMLGEIPNSTPLGLLHDDDTAGYYAIYAAVH